MGYSIPAGTKARCAGCNQLVPVYEGGGFGPCGCMQHRAATPPVAASRPRADGLDAEMELAKALNDGGLYGWIRQYAWALDATPPRKFAADFAYPEARLLVEIKGSAHRVSVTKVYQDCEREALAVSLGWRVLPVHRGMVGDGTAVERIRSALGRGGRERVA